MKCPNCKTDGAYQPLLRHLECVNASCNFYVAPPKKKIFYAIHSVDMKPNKNGDVFLPMKDGVPVFLNGVRQTPAKIPANTRWSTWNTKDKELIGSNPCGEITLPENSRSHIRQPQEVLGLTLPTKAETGETLFIKKGIEAVSMMFDGVRWLRI